MVEQGSAESLLQKQSPFCVRFMIICLLIYEWQMVSLAPNLGPKCKQKRQVVPDVSFASWRLCVRFLLSQIMLYGLRQPATPHTFIGIDPCLCSFFD